LLPQGGTTKVVPSIALWDYLWDRSLLCSQVFEIARIAADTPSAILSDHLFLVSTYLPGSFNNSKDQTIYRADEELPIFGGLRGLAR
jgi:hypothetical protein